MEVQLHVFLVSTLHDKINSYHNYAVDFTWYGAPRCNPSQSVEFRLVNRNISAPDCSLT